MSAVAPGGPISGPASDHLSTYQLAWRSLRRNRMAMAAAWILACLYLLVLVPEFFATADPNARDVQAVAAPPMPLRIWDGGPRLPFVHPLAVTRHPDTQALLWTEDRSRREPLRLFVAGDTYHLLGFIPCSRRLVGLDGMTWHPLGTDRIGQDVWSRLVHGARVSLTIGLMGVVLSFLLGMALGAAAGWYGGWVDRIIQRVTDVLISLPAIPIWMGLSAAVPASWPPLGVYLGITLVLSFMGWTGLARQLRARILAQKNEDYVVAAQLAGASSARIMRVHLIPGSMSHLIVAATLAVPGMILGETALSFLGLGIRPPAVSWGVLLQDAQNLQSLAEMPWLLAPAGAVFLVVLAYNLLGDGLRDAFDPHHQGG
jgi:peptide/nickel transport system permease protein